MIGIIGGYGDIGSFVTGFLDVYGNENIKIGGRKKKELKNSYKNKIFYEYVDINDLELVKNFARDCKLVINCSGVNSDRIPAVARAVLDSDCDYIDLGVNHRLRDLAVSYGQSKKVIYGCGSLPGLAEVLMQYLGEMFEKVEKLNFYYSAQGVFTPAAAEDYFEGLTKENSKSMVYYQKGELKKAEWIDIAEQRLPFCDEPFKVFPYIDEGALYVANKLKIDTGKFHMSFCGKKILEALEHGQRDYATDKKSAIKNLVEGSYMDCGNIGKFAGYVIEAVGFEKTSEELSEKTLYVRLDDPSKLTGFSVAVTALAAISGILKNGCYPLYECCNIAEFVNYIEAFGNTFTVCINQGDKSSFMEEIEGEI